MKKLATVFATLYLCLAFVGSAHASYSYTAPSLPWVGDINQCIGGQYCGGTANEIVVSTPHQFISFVYVHAHDNIGQVHKANLQVFVDGSFVGQQDVPAAGGYLYFPINQYGSTVTLRSVHQSCCGSEETFVSWVQISN